MAQASKEAQLPCSPTMLRNLLKKKEYIGTDYYPAIITEETARRIEAERVRRAKALGRDNRGRKKQPKPMIYKNFSIPRVPEKYQDPIKQAEYAYSLIQSEVSG